MGQECQHSRADREGLVYGRADPGKQASQVIDAVVKARPSACKGVYLKSCCMSARWVPASAWTHLEPGQPVPRVMIRWKDVDRRTGAAPRHSKARRPFLLGGNPNGTRVQRVTGGEVSRRQQKEAAMSQQKNGLLFTSESVTEGHPDKLADFISDSVLDAIFEQTR